MYVKTDRSQVFSRLTLAQYALYLSFPTISASFSAPQVLISLLLCISASLFSFLCLTILRQRFLCCTRMRILLPLVFGSAVAGANFISLNGTVFFPRSNLFAQTNADRNHRDSVTMSEFSEALDLDHEDVS